MNTHLHSKKGLLIDMLLLFKILAATLLSVISKISALIKMQDCET